MVMLISVLVGAVISAVLYRMGGAKGYNTKFRDLGCPTVFMACLLVNWRPDTLLGWLLLIPVFGLMFGGLTTYWDELFGKEDNFFMHGFMIALACFPLFWAGIHWWAIGIRCVILAVSMGVWCKIFSNDIVEECGRGAFIILSLPILLL